MLAIDRLKRITSGGKRLSKADCQRSSDSLDSPGSVLSVEMVPTPQYSQEVSFARINPKKSPSGDSLNRNSSGPEMTTFQQPRDTGLGSSVSSLNSSEYACVFPVVPSGQYHSNPESTESGSDRSKSGSNTPKGVEEPTVERHAGYVINNVDNLEFSPKVPQSHPPAVAPKPKPVAKIIGKASSVHYEASHDSGQGGSDGSGQTTPTNTLRKNCTLKRVNSPKLRQEHTYAEPVKSMIQAPASAPVFSQFSVSKPFTTTTSPYGTLASGHYGKTTMAPPYSSPGPVHAPYNLPATSYSAASPVPNVMTVSAPNSSVAFHASTGKIQKKAPPPPPKRSNSMTESTRTDRNGLEDAVDSKLPSLGTQQQDSFASCVKNLSARFGKMREEKQADNSSDTASISDSEEFPPPPPPIAMEIITPKIHSYGILGKSVKGTLPRESPERTGGYLQKHISANSSNSYGDWSSSVNTLPHNRSADLERVRTETESATLMRPNKGGLPRDCNGSHDLNASSVSIDSNTLPFANENVGTIKQRVPAGKPSIVQAGEGYEGGERNVSLNSNLFEERSAVGQRHPEYDGSSLHRKQAMSSPRGKLNRSDYQMYLLPLAAQCLPVTVN